MRSRKANETETDYLLAHERSVFAKWLGLYSISGFAIFLYAYLGGF